MRVDAPVRRFESWASDLVHPLPLAAVGVLALNDHLLKGSGALPGAVTGKLSDFAGLFFFPLLLAAAARGASRAVRGRDVADRRSLAAATAVATALGFAAVKLIPQVNALVGATWGRMVMDPSDLWALPMVGLAAAWMLRGGQSGAESRLAVSRAPRGDLRRAFDFTALIAAGLASAATSKAPPPQPPPQPPQPVAMAVAEDAACAELTVDTCERTSSQTLVVVRARSRSGDVCRLDVLRAEESSYDGHVSADVLPKNVTVRGSESRTFALTFLRPVSSDEMNGALDSRAQIQHTASDGSTSVEELAFQGGCAGR